MNDAAAFAQSFIPKPDAVQGLVDGTLQRIGSVIYHVGGGIHSHMQETAAFNPAKLLAGVNEVSGQLTHVSQGLQLLKVSQFANVALSAVDIGVSVAGFVVMNAKLNALRTDVQALSANIELLREEKFEEDFVMLSTFLQRFEEAWFWRNIDKAEDEWRAIASEARRYQDLFEYRAKRLLAGPSPAYAVADRMVDALSTIGGLRFSAAMAASEDKLATRIAEQCADQVTALTGKIGLVELVKSSLPPGMAPGSAGWATQIRLASDKAEPLAAKFREREARAATRSAPLSMLPEHGLSPHRWLRMAREETAEPLLVLSPALSSA
ncbi:MULTISPECIES: hypothetical protein [Sphingomonas]|jgi:hypothetical protein|uniref:hypothetical protein n=1 Tax=Sphingomonas TaxID=13687 RepID=UPI000368DCAC|nr:MULTISPECIES: hypothetical protein [Sphingomonas]MCP4026782.1 hypothetical protein [Sphingomonas sp.]